MWTLADGRHFYVEERALAKGGGLVTLFLADYDEFVSMAAERGLRPDREETYANGVRKATYRDPDGNEIGIGGAPGRGGGDRCRTGRGCPRDQCDDPAAKAYGRPVGGGRGGYVSFAVPERPELAALINTAASRAGSLWATHRGL